MTATATRRDDAERVAAAVAGDYLAVRVLADDTVAALGDLLFTRAIYLDCDRHGYARRFCFADPTVATVAFFMLESSDDEPAGAIARR